MGNSGSSSSAATTAAAPAAKPVAAAAGAGLSGPKFPYTVLDMKVDEQLHKEYEATPELLK